MSNNSDNSLFDYFDTIYKYIEMQIKANNASFYTYRSYQLYLKADNDLRIILKKDNYTLSGISREKGIFSLAKIERDNMKSISETNQLLLEILKNELVKMIEE